MARTKTAFGSRFDDVIMLHAGEITFHGPANQISAFFDDMGFPCPGNFNPADHVSRSGSVLGHRSGGFWVELVNQNDPKCSTCLVLLFGFRSPNSWIAHAIVS